MFVLNILLLLLFNHHHVQLFVTPWTAACQAPLSSTISLSLLKFTYIELVVLFSCLILCHSLVLFPSIFSSIKVFSNESAPRIMWPKYWSFNFNISPSNECSGLISFRIDCFDLLGNLKESSIYAQRLSSVRFFLNPMDLTLSGSSLHWIFPHMNTGVGGHFLSQRLFPTQRSNPRLLRLLH